MTTPAIETLYCHVCGEPLSEGNMGFSPYEYTCQTCQTAYHLEGELASYVTPSFVEHHEAPVVVPISHLRDPHHIRHSS